MISLRGDGQLRALRCLGLVGVGPIRQWARGAWLGRLRLPKYHWDMVRTPEEMPSIGLVLESVRRGGPGNVRSGDFTERWSWLAIMSTVGVQDR